MKHMSKETFNAEFHREVQALCLKHRVRRCEVLVFRGQFDERPVKQSIEGASLVPGPFDVGPTEWISRSFLVVPELVELPPMKGLE